MADSALTMEEIARRLGISVATVSRSLNDKPGVGAATRQRVLELAARENYAPNGAARGLATAQSHMVAFITAQRSVPFAEDYFYQRVMLGAQQELMRAGYYLIVTAVESNELDELAHLRLFRGGRADSVLLVGPEIPARSILGLQASGVPIVLIDNALPHTPIDCVLSDDEMGGYSATSHLLAHGRRRVVALTGPLAWHSSAARLRGYTEALQEMAALQKLDLPTRAVHHNETTAESGYAAMQEALATYPDLDAVFAVNDSMAIGAMRALREAGRQVPQDVAIIGFDDIEVAAHVEPPLTTVKINKLQMGVVAARRLVDLMSGEPAAPVRSIVGVNLLVRASCGCEAAQTPPSSP